MEIEVMNDEGIFIARIFATPEMKREQFKREVHKRGALFVICSSFIVSRKTILLLPQR